MAENVNITPGTGDVVAADDISDVKYQKIKLVDGTADSTTVVAVDVGVKANALRTAPASDITDGTYIGDINFGESLPAGTALVGKVGIDQVTANANEVVVKSGAITETNSGTIAGDTTSIDGKITACNTGAVVVSSGAITETNSTAILADTASLDTKITACNTGAVVVSSGAITETNSGTIAGDTTSIDGKITACNTGAVVLAAGTAGIGKLTANSGVDIGDVDVLSTSIDGSINGPAEPTVDSYTQAAISAVTGANQSIVAAPGASKQIWVYGIEFGNTTAGTVAFQDEDDTAITGVMPFADNGGMAVSPSGNFAMPLWKVATNKALEADVTTGTINGSITYGIISV